MAIKFGMIGLVGVVGVVEVVGVPTPFCKTCFSTSEYQYQIQRLNFSATHQLVKKDQINQAGVPPLPPQTDKAYFKTLFCHGHLPLGQPILMFRKQGAVTGTFWEPLPEKQLLN